ncbi:NUDIX hydrolase [Candidatus Parcubacteria bacterium]|nr:NUDIX hydrolase [Candidatus Parcubacteria bacterium]
MESPKKSHFSCGLIYRNNPTSGRLEFLVHDVISTKGERVSPKQTKFPGGNNRTTINPEETPEFTAAREILEETYLTVAPENLQKIWEYEAPSDHDKPGQHTKYGFLVSLGECQGTIRTTILTDNEDTMGVPYWLPPEELKFRLFGGHQIPFLRACERLGLL